MLRPICDSYKFSNEEITYEKENIRYITIEYDSSNAEDKTLIIEMLNKQPKCVNCNNYRIEGAFCGYNAHYCNVDGHLLEWADDDGSKCKNYKRKEETIHKGE